MDGFEYLLSLVIAHTYAADWKALIVASGLGEIKSNACLIDVYIKAIRVHRADIHRQQHYELLVVHGVAGNIFEAHLVRRSLAVIPGQFPQLYCLLVVHVVVLDQQQKNIFAGAFYTLLDTLERVHINLYGPRCFVQTFVLLLTQVFQMGAE